MWRQLRELRTPSVRPLTPLVQKQEEMLQEKSLSTTKFIIFVELVDESKNKTVKKNHARLKNKVQSGFVFLFFLQESSSFTQKLRAYHGVCVCAALQHTPAWAVLPDVTQRSMMSGGVQQRALQA